MMESTVKALGPGLAAVILACACYGDDQAGTAEKETNASIFVATDPAPIADSQSSPALNRANGGSQAADLRKPPLSQSFQQPVAPSGGTSPTVAQRLAPQLRLLAVPFADAIHVILASEVAARSEGATEMYVSFSLRGSSGVRCKSELMRRTRRPGSDTVAGWPFTQSFPPNERCAFAAGQTYRVSANLFFDDGSVAVVQSEELVVDGALLQYEVEEELTGLGFFWQRGELATAVGQSCGSFWSTERNQAEPLFEIMTTQFLSIHPPHDRVGCWGHHEDRLFFGRSPVWFASVPSEDPDDPIANRVQRAAFRRLRQAVTAAGFVVIER
jgi:hypothetical protein